MTSSLASPTISIMPFKFLFWSLAASNAVLIVLVVVLVIGEVFTNHPPDLGHGLLTLILLSAALGLVVWLYTSSNDLRVQRLLITILAAPVLGALAIFIYFASSSWRDDLGSGYFSGGGEESALQPMAKAVVRRDIAYVKKHGPGVDLNLKSKRGMTLLKLAFHKLGPSQLYASPAVELPVIKALLELGAKPGDELWRAFVLSDWSILTALLEGGADPNRMPPRDCPLMQRVGDIELEKFLLLVGHGLKIDTICNGQPFAAEIARYGRSELLAYLIEHGADISKPAEDGETVASIVDRNIARAVGAGEAPNPELLRVRALIGQRR